jgi:uncharacterized protein (DUF488 family)
VIVYTIGHSTRSIGEFIAILQEAAATRVADVRAFPASRRHPQFNRGALNAALEDAGIDYHHLPALGGRRGRTKIGPSRNGLWKVEAFRNYADYAETLGSMRSRCWRASGRRPSCARRRSGGSATAG